MSNIIEKSKNVVMTHKGLVLILVAAGIAIMLIMTAAMARLGLQARIFAIRTTQEILARTAADAGHDRALFELNKMTSDWPASNDPFPLPQSGDLPGTNQDYTFTVTLADPPPMGLENYVPYIFNIESTGRSGTTSPKERKVYSTVYLRCPNQYGIFMQDTLELKNSGGIDGYDSSKGQYGDPIDGGNNSGMGVEIGTNASGEGDVTLRLNADISPGSEIHVGPLDQPGAAAEACDVVGGQGFFDPACIVSEPVKRPISEWELQGTPPGLGILTVKAGKDDCLNCNGSPYVYQGVDVRNGATLRVKGDPNDPIEVVVSVGTGGFVLGQSAILLIENNATLILYLAGEFDARQSSIINNSNNQPSNLVIRGTSQCQKIILHNDGDFKGVIDAPYAFLDIQNSGDFYGSVFADSAVIRNTGGFHYDFALQEIVMGDLGAYFHVAKWREE